MADRDLDQEIRQLREDFATLQADVSELAGALREAGLGRAEEARDSAAERLRARRERVEEQLRAARSRGREALGDFEETVGGHPLGSLATAFGAGFVLAKLMDLGVRR
jgi:ElaB/YqjD/DUF883 family membrane-anchored ribosome-binding protein